MADSAQQIGAGDARCVENFHNYSCSDSVKPRPMFFGAIVGRGSFAGDELLPHSLGDSGRLGGILDGCKGGFREATHAPWADQTTVI